jgi:hypothetical protein
VSQSRTPPASNAAEFALPPTSYNDNNGGHHQWLAGGIKPLAHFLSPSDLTRESIRSLTLGSYCRRGSEGGSIFLGGKPISVQTATHCITIVRWLVGVTLLPTTSITINITASIIYYIILFRRSVVWSGLV